MLADYDKHITLISVLYFLDLLVGHAAGLIYLQVSPAFFLFPLSTLLCALSDASQSHILAAHTYS